MDWGYFIGLGALLAGGIVVLVAVAWVARRRDERDRTAWSRPPERDIPGFDPDEVRPEYLAELESRQAPEGALTTDLDDDARARLERDLPAADLILDAGYPVREFATDRPTGYAILTDPLIAWCADQVGSMRELLAVVDRLGGPTLAERRSLVIIAPGFDGEVVDTLRANVVRRKLRVCPIWGGDDDLLAALSELTGAKPLTRADLQAGYVGDTLGTCRRWAADAERSWIVGPDRIEGTPPDERHAPHAQPSPES